MTQKRRANGEGSYRQRKNGSWEARFTIGGRLYSRYGATRQEVMQKRKQAERDHASGVNLSHKHQTVGTYLQTWLQESVKRAVSIRTYDSYGAMVRLHITPAIGSVRLDRLTADHVRRMMNDMVDAGLSARTAAYARTVLRIALGQAERDGYVIRNVATLAKPPKQTRIEIQTLTPEQAAQFLEYARQSENRLWPLFSVTLRTGMRLGEVTGLRWSDVDMTAGSITIRQTVQWRGGMWLFSQPKTERSRRTLHLTPAALEALRAQRDKQAFERKQVIDRGDHWEECGLVFTTTTGTPIDGSNLSKRLHEVLTAAGLPKQRFHDLRHCAASMMVARGVHMREVMEQIGHSQISLTMDLYSHVMPTGLKAAAEAIDDALSSNKSGG